MENIIFKGKAGVFNYFLNNISFGGEYKISDIIDMLNREGCNLDYDFLNDYSEWSLIPFRGDNLNCYVNLKSPDGIEYFAHDINYSPVMGWYFIGEIIFKLNYRDRIIDKIKDISDSKTFWGIECDDGWLKLIDTLIDNINFQIKNNGMPPIFINQIKEKFGGLRFYYDGGDDMTAGMVTLAESLSYQICENCGSMKNIGKTTGWIKTLCKECAGKDPNWSQN